MGSKLCVRGPLPSQQACTDMFGWLNNLAFPSQEIVYFRLWDCIGCHFW